MTDKEQQIEQMAKIISSVTYDYGKDIDIARALVNAGCGNVKEFADKLKKQMELNGYRSPLHNRIIDNLINEIYGEKK